MKVDLNDKLVRFVAQEYVNKISNYSSEDELNYDVHKLIHTFAVVAMAQNLIDHTKPALSPKLKKQILNAAVLHDIGRCHEFKNGIHLKVDHGKIGANLIKKHFPGMEIEAQSTLYHNKCPSDKDPQMVQPVLDYVRDADILANIKYQIERTDLFLIHIFGNSEKSLLTPVIDREIFKSVRKRHSVEIKRIGTNNLLTKWLAQLCWFYNLKTDSGIEYAKKEKLFIRFKQTIIKKIIPLTTKNKKKQEELTQKIQTSFPDKLFLS